MANCFSNLLSWLKNIAFMAAGISMLAVSALAEQKPVADYTEIVPLYSRADPMQSKVGEENMHLIVLFDDKESTLELRVETPNCRKTDRTKYEMRLPVNALYTNISTMCPTVIFYPEDMQLKVKKQEAGVISYDRAKNAYSFQLRECLPVEESSIASTKLSIAEHAKEWTIDKVPLVNTAVGEIVRRGNERYRQTIRDAIRELGDDYEALEVQWNPLDRWTAPPETFRSIQFRVKRAEENKKPLSLYYNIALTGQESMGQLKGKLEFSLQPMQGNGLDSFVFQQDELPAGYVLSSNRAAFQKFGMVKNPGEAELPETEFLRILSDKAYIALYSKQEDEASLPRAALISLVPRAGTKQEDINYFIKDSQENNNVFAICKKGKAYIISGNVSEGIRLSNQELASLQQSLRKFSQRIRADETLKEQ